MIPDSWDAMVAVYVNRIAELAGAMVLELKSSPDKRGNVFYLTMQKDGKTATVEFSQHALEHPRKFDQQGIADNFLLSIGG